MTFDKIEVQIGIALSDIKFSDSLNKDILLESCDVKTTEISSHSLIKKLKDLNKKKEECIKNEFFEDAAQYRATEWRILADSVEINLNGVYRTTYLTNQTLTYLVVKGPTEKLKTCKE